MMADPIAHARMITKYPNKRVAVGMREETDLREFLSRPVVVPCENEKQLKALKESQALWSPGTFVGNHRSKATCESLFGLGFDLDEEPVISFDRGLEVLKGLSAALSTSFRHRIDAPRLRLILFTDRLITGAEYDKLWPRYADCLLKLGIGVGSAAKDPSRAWFVPSVPSLTGYEYRSAFIEGKTIPVDADLASLVEKPKPQKLRLVKPVLERARMFVDTWDIAVDGEGGSNVAFAHIERLVRGFELTDAEALEVLQSWNNRCVPPWSEKELLHKIQDGRERGDTSPGELRDAQKAPREESDEHPTTKLIEDNGSPAKIAENVARMMADYPRGRLRLDLFGDRIVWPDGQQFSDSDEVAIQGWLFSRTQSKRVRASLQTVRSGCIASAQQSSFHPVRDYLRSLRWDGGQRVDKLFTSYFGSADSDYVRAASRCFMVGAVARIMRPGCKLDTMPVLEGTQGAFKSTGLRILASDAWFSDTEIPNKTPDKYQALVGVWIYEIAELSSLRGRDSSQTKAFISSLNDNFRKSYGHHNERVPRQVCFVGTTNPTDYLEDTTGNRRYHPIVCGRVDREELVRDRDQLWAEAVHRYDAGAEWWLESEHMSAHAEAAASRLYEDPWSVHVNALATHQQIRVSDLLATIGVAPEKQGVPEAKRLAALLRMAGWRKSRIGTVHREWRWVHGLSTIEST